jgi:hypothetical protein
MVRKLLKVTVAGALGLAALLIAYSSGSSAADTKVVEISEIMRKSFKDKNNYKTSIGAAAKAGKWEDATKLAKEWADLGAVIGQNKPPKGTDESWKMQCEKFATNTKNILKACEDKDAKAVTKGLGSFDCMGCHKAHR